MKLFFVLHLLIIPFLGYTQDIAVKTNPLIQKGNELQISFEITNLSSEDLYFPRLSSVDYYVDGNVVNIYFSLVKPVQFVEMGYNYLRYQDVLIIKPGRKKSFTKKVFIVKSDSFVTFRPVSLTTEQIESLTSCNIIIGYVTKTKLSLDALAKKNTISIMSDRYYSFEENQEEFTFSKLIDK